MLDCMISTMTSNYMSYLGSGSLPQPMGTGFPTVVPYRVFPTRDRAVAIAVGSEKLWTAFCRVIERPDLERHPDYASNAVRIRNRGTLEPLLEEIFLTRPVAEWIPLLQAAGIPASPVRNFQDVVDHPQSHVRRMFPQLEHLSAGVHRVTGTPVKLSQTPGAAGEAAPLVGQHTSEILRDLLGLDIPAFESLANRGIVFETKPTRSEPCP
jgi:crotonobetainyl-CoA:carnitine CoA-transferase CaiB-like acyl-CoA transferase